nr:hypothetical protein L203_06207 [Cryptococcus depauperatus CBS 7841]ODN94888.1 hypothetical protein L204_04228 [Cryptococcus depauperatus CBS 7855]
MPRSSRSSARPTAPPPSHSQSRQAHTAAYPQQTSSHAAPQTNHAQQQRQPGLFAQAASTMGGAVAGSVVGHGISNMLFGGSGHQQQAAPAQDPIQQQQLSGASCDIQAKDFTKCLEATNGDMQSCGYYLEALSKAF